MARQGLFPRYGKDSLLDDSSQAAMPAYARFLYFCRERLSSSGVDSRCRSRTTEVRFQRTSAVLRPNGSGRIPRGRGEGAATDGTAGFEE